MNELTVAFESVFELIGANLGVFVGIPIMFITLHFAVSMVKIMCGAGNCRRRPEVVDKRQQYPRGEKRYVPPVLEVVKCPVSEDCKKCRFYNTDSCLRGYL